MSNWTIVEAVATINKVWLSCETAGYHLAPTGSVLRHGYSDNDLDLVIYPRELSGDFTLTIAPPSRFSEQH